MTVIIVYLPCGLCLVKQVFAKEIWYQSWSALDQSTVSLIYMSLVTRKPVFGVFDQVRLKLACAATEAS